MPVSLRTRRRSGLSRSTTNIGMPSGDLLDGSGNVVWRQDYAEDFNTNVSLGGFLNSTSGDLGMFDSSSPGGAAYRDSWKSGSAMQQGTSEPNTFYDAVGTMSASNSILRTDMFVASDGTLRASKFKPIFGNGVDFTEPTKIITRYRSGGAAGFTYVFDWIGSDADWVAGGGELGASENGTNAANLHLFYRPKVADSSEYAANIDSEDIGGSANDWHIVSTTWFPGVSITTEVDGAVAWSTTDRVWTTAKRWVQQGGGTATTIGLTAFIEIDWTVAYTYVGPLSGYAVGYTKGYGGT
jgi:hypothetical protein